MCLNKLRTGPIFSKPTYGYKVFKEVKGKLYGEMMVDEPLPVNKWIYSNRYNERACVDNLTDTRDYKLGWHVFEKRKDAVNWKNIDGLLNNLVIRKVLVKGIHCFGYQGEAKTLVCRKIKILLNG